MIRSLYTAERAMLMEQVRIDALANNLANVDSTGFRQVLTRVTEDATGTAAEGVSGSLQTSSEWPGIPPLEMGHALDARPGPVTPTGRETDLAIMGRGFFVVATEEGERYTRNGSFLLNEQRQLVNAEGQLIQGDGGPIILDGREFTIEQDGNIVVDGSVAGRVRLVDFTDPSKLEHMGANLLQAPEDLPAQPVPDSEILVAQGHLEGSNVDPVSTLVAMIQAQRAFEVQAKIMMTEDEMLNKSVNNLPRVTA